MAHVEPAHRTVKDIMTRNIVAVAPNATAADIARIMADNNVGSVLVTEQSRLQGIITDRQLVTECLAKGHDPATCRADQTMTRNPIAISPDTLETDAIHLMGEHQIRRLPVVENNAVVGIVSVADLAKDLVDCPECVQDLAMELSKAA